MQKKLALLIALTVTLGLTSPAAVPFAQAAATTTAPATDNKTVQPDTNNTDTRTDSTEEKSNTLSPALLAEAQAFIDYAAQIKSLDAYSEKASVALDKVPEITAANRQKVYAILTNTAIPSYTKLVAGLKKIKPAHAELAQIHAQFIKANSLQLEGVTLLQKYVSSPKLDNALLSKAGIKFNAAITAVKTYQQAIDKYTAKFN